VNLVTYLVWRVMVGKKTRERREKHEERSGVDRRAGGDRRKKQVLIDHPDRRGSGERRKGERREGRDRRGKKSGSKRARPRTYHDSQGAPPDDGPRRRTYRDT
jgi:hypothetical protein